MSAALRFKNRYTKGSRFHGFKKKKEEMETSGKFYAQREFRKRKSGRNETDSRTRKKGYTSF
jgi:hypothetical protein